MIPEKRIEREETTIGMSLDDFNEAQEDQPFELIDGERLAKMPNVFGHTWFINMLYRVLLRFVEQNDLGEVFVESTYTQMTQGNWVKGARIPDIVFYTKNRIRAFQQQHANWRTIPLNVAPDLTIEVISPTERATDINKKVKADKANGVRLTWAIDIENESVLVYYLGQVIELGREDNLDGMDVLPHFSFKLARLFDTENL